jgi:hypothetical protein
MRHPNDFYPTPPWCYEHLPIDWSQFKTAHEAGAGDGRIVSFLENKGIETTYSEIEEGKNFFDYDGEVDLVFTNPPFSLAQEFIEHALACAPTVIMLLRINFLGSQKRYDFWQQFPPDGLFILSKRPSFTGKGTDSIDYAWFVWSDIKELQGVHWIK